MIESIGYIVCVAGGIILTTGLIGSGIIWVAGKVTSVMAIGRIIIYARKHGLDLTTGEPVSREGNER